MRMIGHLTDVTHRPEVKAALAQADAGQIAGYRAPGGLLPRAPTSRITRGKTGPNDVQQWNETLTQYKEIVL
jgi:hypothetical protein